ncbi:LysR family transcriptional regulator [Pseudomonadota bacterium]
MEEKIEQILYKSNIIQPLKGFCNTVQEGSINKAAEKMSLTQSTVTKQIQALERDLQVQLFDRSGQSVVPTKEGKIFYELVLPKLQAFENLFEQFLGKRNKEEIDVISIAAHHVAMSHVLPNYIHKYQTLNTKNKKIEFLLHNISRSDAFKLLDEKKIDFMLYPRGDVPIKFYFREIMSYEPVLILYKDHPLAKKKSKRITFEDMAKSNFIHLGTNITIPMFKEVAVNYNIKSNITLINGTWEIVKGLTKARVGISGIASLYVEKDDASIVYKNISHILPKLEYGIMINKSHKLKPFVKKFIEVVKSDFFIDINL